MPWYEFCLERVSRDFSKDEMSEFSLNNTVFDFSVSHKAVEEEDKRNIVDYLMKNDSME